MSYFDTDNDFTFEDRYPGRLGHFGSECANCQRTSHQVEIEQIYTDDGEKLLLCDDCAAEVRRVEKLADQLAALPSCEVRSQIIDSAATIRSLVHALTAHDQTGCAVCFAARQLAAEEKAA